MILNEVIYDLKLKGSRSHRDYETMVAFWYEEEGNPLPSYEKCLHTWDNVTIPRLKLEGIKEKIQAIKNEAKQIIESLEWKVSRHLQQRELGIETSLTNDEYLMLLSNIQDIRDWSNTEEAKLLSGE